jgi:hypothetical protein
MHLTGALQNIDSFLGCDHRVAIEIGRPLFKLSEILNALQRPLRAEQALNIHTA